MKERKVQGTTSLYEISNKESIEDNSNWTHDLRTS